MAEALDDKAKFLIHVEQSPGEKQRQELHSADISSKGYLVHLGPLPKVSLQL